MTEQKTKKKTTEKKSWLALTVPFSPLYEDLVATFLVELTGTGIEFSKEGITTYLPLDDHLISKLMAIDAFLKKIAGDISGESNGFWYTRIIHEENWSKTWKSYFKPVRIGQRIVVTPSWEKISASRGQIVVFIDPGRAFGVGTHPTTRLCVEYIEAFSSEMACSSMSRWSFCDLGCGTGILAIVAALLGAEKVLAVDLDPVAVEIAKKNIVRNRVERIVRTVEGSIEKVNEKYTCIAANLITRTINDLAPHFRDCLEEGGRLILSGILREEAGQVEKRYVQTGYEPVDLMIADEWARMVFTSKGEKV